MVLSPLALALANAPRFWPALHPIQTEQVLAEVLVQPAPLVIQVQELPAQQDQQATANGQFQETIFIIITVAM